MAAEHMNTIDLRHTINLIALWRGGVVVVVGKALHDMRISNTSVHPNFKNIRM